MSLRNVRSLPVRLLIGVVGPFRAAPAGRVGRLDRTIHQDGCMAVRPAYRRMIHVPPNPAWFAPTMCMRSEGLLLLIHKVARRVIKLFSVELLKAGNQSHFSQCCDAVMAPTLIRRSARSGSRA